MSVEEFKVKTKPKITHLGLFISLIGFWLVAIAYYTVARLVGFSGPRSSLVYTLAQLTGFAALLYVIREEGGGLLECLVRRGRKERLRLCDGFPRRSLNCMGAHGVYRLGYRNT